MVAVLFVCLGNICRSPMAEAIFRNQVSEAGLLNEVDIDSAGTGHWHIGKPAHDGTLGLLKQKQIAHDDLIARQVTRDDLKKYDLVIAMDEQNFSDLQNMRKVEDDVEISLLLDYLPEQRDKNVPDPYFTGDFEEVYALISESCENLLADVRNRWLVS
ncbi:low molecular weight protein-tyrosine-phosphatase [Geomicrobium sp. JSM 1781026]|uniref:low molecular weight protein-tyrosine-phosphatase n=1 Tax=Geomicrobium sp. JSM 1781026 TaxID=3344580 RepID=UPI0035BF76FF